jgi:hypothetical protein
VYSSFETYSPMPPVDELALRARLAQLKEEHRDLDAAIAALESGPIVDGLGVQRLKKRKLSLRDQIGAIENSLIPDIIA